MSVRKEISSMAAPCSSGNVAEQFLVTDWDQHSVDQSMKLSGSTGLSSYNVGSSNSELIERIPSLSCFGSESLSEIIGSLALPESTQMASALCLQDFPSTNEHGLEKNFKGKKRKRMPECSALQFPLQKDNPPETVKSPIENDEKKQKSEVNPDPQNGGGATKEDYIHVRAKRGQATNSHSLAERVRREKISERMRLLQDLVPGCNKITGKAVMLDEIINYVQSLQRQVEFLSMKLAAVIPVNHPELNLDFEQIFSKENLHSRYGSSSALGYGPEMGTSHPHLQAEMGIPSIPNSRNMPRTTTNPQISTMNQISSAWDDEFHNAVRMGFIPNLPFESMELNGSMKVGL